MKTHEALASIDASIDLSTVTGGYVGNDGGCCPPWPRPPTGPLGPLGPRNPLGPLSGS